MLRCSKCGQENPEGETFCAHCGSRIKEPHVPAAVAARAATHKAANEKKNIGLLLMLVGLIVIVLSLLLLLGVI